MGLFLLPLWRTECNNENTAGKVTSFIIAKKTNSPMRKTCATISPPVGDAFMHIETSGTNFGSNVFVSFERTEAIQIGNNMFCYSRYSNATSNFRSIRRPRFQ